LTEPSKVIVICTGHLPSSTKGNTLLPKLDVHHFICRQDNYGVLLHDGATGETASIDAPESQAIERELGAKGWKLSHILTTHHHVDHVEGNLVLKRKWNAKIIGPKAEASQIPGIDLGVSDGESYQFAGREVRVIATPGHTKGHIVLHLPQENLLFAGDTLFALGCGRVIEGTHAEMWDSLDRLRKLPPETAFHCGHEYTESNARFALTIEPGNKALVARAEKIKAQRARGEMTLPGTIGEELATNVFLRPESKEVRSVLGMPHAGKAEVFAEIRKRKDSFR
jgi:hydroxyacylglutathione hydrolase